MDPHDSPKLNCHPNINSTVQTVELEVGNKYIKSYYDGLKSLVLLRPFTLYIMQEPSMFIRNKTKCNELV